MDKISALENRLFNAISDNLKELEKIKEAAKSELKSNNLSFPQRTHALNIILLVNEMIAASKSETESNPDLKAFYQEARISAGKATEVSEDQDDLKEQFNKSVVALNNRGAHLNNSKVNDFLNDIQMYGMMSLTLREDLTKSIIDLLQEVHPEIPMLKTTGDGNCFYNAISTEDYILENNPELNEIQDEKQEGRHEALREATIEQMRKSQAKQSEINYHIKNGAWATDEQIRQLVVAEDKPILVLAHDPVDKTKIFGTIYVKKGGAPLDPDNLRVIVNIDNRHFNALYTTHDNRQGLIEHYNEQIVPVA